MPQMQLPFTDFAAEIPDDISGAAFLYAVKAEEQIYKKRALNRRCLWEAYGESVDSCESPIEQLVLVAWQIIADANLIPISIGKQTRADALLTVTPQWKCGPYYIDFKLTSGDRTLLIETDGHEYHDRDEKQRTYENKRARYLSAQHGLFLDRYTGAVVVSDPCAVALIGFNGVAQTWGKVFNPFHMRD